MPYLIGADEAGYGPNLGPLVVGASLWRVPEQMAAEDLYHALRRCVAADAAARRRGLLAIADSKQLYKPGGGLAELEYGVLAASARLGPIPSRWREIWPVFDSRVMPDLHAQPWHEDYDLDLPLAAAPGEMHALAARFSEGLSGAGIELRALRAAVVFPERFNRLVHEHGNKAAALSSISLDLVAEMLAPLNEPVQVVCDKHGGRNVYGPFLQRRFPDDLVQVACESRLESRYRFGPPERQAVVSFSSKGERFLPSALASMICKYLRELAMRPLNEFWARHVPGIRPTAGYPEDAARFKRQIAAAQTKLGVPDSLLWRIR